MKSDHRRPRNISQEYGTHVCLSPSQSSLIACSTRRTLPVVGFGTVLCKLKLRDFSWRHVSATSLYKYMLAYQFSDIESTPICLNTAYNLPPGTTNARLALTSPSALRITYKYWEINPSFPRHASRLGPRAHSQPPITLLYPWSFDAWRIFALALSYSRQHSHSDTASILLKYTFIGLQNAPSTTCNKLQNASELRAI